jgi:hypothetical protein
MPLKLVHKLGAFALAVVFAALPVMACEVPDAAMTQSERACCKKMARQCGGMGMAKSHPCCQSTATPADFHALKAPSSQITQFSFIVFHALPVTFQVDTHFSLTRLSCQVSGAHGPPGLASTFPTILRI